MTAARPLHITNYGLHLATGDEARGLLGATMAGLPAFEIDTTLSVTLGDGDPRPHLPIVGPLPAMMPPLDDALETALATLAGQVDKLLFIEPGADTGRLPLIDELLEDAAPHDLPEHWLERVSEAHFPERLQAVLAPLHDGTPGRVGVLGCDSLTHLDTLNRYAQENWLRTDKARWGKALGEGLAWFVLSTEPGTGEDVQWHPLGLDHEPHYCKRRHVALMGLTHAITQAGMEEWPALVIHARAQTEPDDLEWHHARQRLWPQQLSRRENLAMRKGELEAPQPPPRPPQQHLKPALSVGELGAAGFPAAVILAAERLTWPLQPLPRALLTDTPDHYSARLAIDLTHSPVQGGHDE